MPKKDINVGDPDYGVKKSQVKAKEAPPLPKGPSWDDYMHPRKWKPRPSRLPSNTVLEEKKQEDEAWKDVLIRTKKKEK